MQKIEHIGIAVKDIKSATAIYEALFGNPPYKSETVASEQVETVFFRNGPNKIELLAATSDDSSIAKSIAARGEGMHHIAFAVTDIQKEMERLKSEGFQLLSKKPKKGADNKLICFVHPKSANGVLIELCQEIEQ